MQCRLFQTALTCFLSFCTAQVHADDVAEGRDYFLNQCLGCHAFACNRDGDAAYAPKLGGLFGRKAGGVEDFTGYSKALKDSSIVWTDATLDDYLNDPAAIDPEGLMADYVKIDDASLRRKIIAFLKTEDPSVDLFCD